MKKSQWADAPPTSSTSNPNDWKWFEENYEPYKPPKIEKEKNHRPQIALPKILAGEVATPLRLAPRWVRLVAAIVDTLLAVGIPTFLFVVSVASLVARHQAGEELGPEERSELMIGLAIVGGSFLIIGLINLILLGVRGQTIGKAMLGIKIVGTDGHPCFARIFFIRYLTMNILTSIPVVGFFIALTDILLIFRDSRQCLHDQLADTIVVRAR